MATAVAQPVSAIRDDQVMDTRTPSPSPVQRSAGGSSDAQSQNGVDEGYKPDLSNEVAMLSTKLVNAINYQTNLDDSLQATRHELEQARQELKKVRAEKQSLDDAVTQGVLVKKSEVEKTMAKLRADLILEKEKRESAEKAKRQTDGELENLTSSLFEEANKMVAEARKDTDAVEKRNSQLRSQLSDTEVLLASQQEQLQDLKLTMENLERTQTSARDSSVPSTPITSQTATFDALQHSPSAEVADIPPNHPLHFSQILSPILRTDVSAYTDFAELLSNARKAAPHSRNASGNMSSASQTNLSSLATNSAAASSSPNLPGAFAFNSSSASSSPSSSTFANTVNPPLKETKFYKRSLIEDLEPTLRLDLAPGLSFLSRRSVQSALLNGTLVVEPFAPSSSWKLYSPVFACALCGESRKMEPYVRKHRFRTSESDDAQRYPLCDFCLSRIRAAGDFVGFLRMVRDGHWRCGNEEEEKAAWEEAVRLRERMFWARLGGGVVPAAFQRAVNGNAPETPSKAVARNVEGRASLESIPEARSRRSTATTEDRMRVSEDVFNGPKEVTGDADAIGVGIVSSPSAEPGIQGPELKQQDSYSSAQEEQADGESEERAKDLTKELRRRTFLRAGEEIPGLQEKLSEGESQQEQHDASEQLRQEDEAAAASQTLPPVEGTLSAQQDEEFKTPNQEVDDPMAASTTVSATTEDQTSTPQASVTTTSRPASPVKSSSRPSSQSSQRPSSRTSQRSPERKSQTDLAPPQRPSAERASSSQSSVLARVRAMEGKK